MQIATGAFAARFATLHQLQPTTAARRTDLFNDIRRRPLPVLDPCDQLVDRLVHLAQIAKSQSRQRVKHIQNSLRTPQKQFQIILVEGRCAIAPEDQGQLKEIVRGSSGATTRLISTERLPVHSYSEPSLTVLSSPVPSHRESSLRARLCASLLLLWQRIHRYLIADSFLHSQSMELTA